MDIRAVIDRLRRFPYPGTVAVVVAVWFVYLVLGYYLAPRLIAQGITDFTADRLQRKATVGSVRVNPLLFRVRVKDFALTENDGAPIAAFKRLLVDFELSSIVRWAWTFSSIRLDGLDLRAEIRPDGTLNLAALAAGLRGSEQKEGDGRPPRLLLQHALLRGGAATFTDRTGSAPASATLQPLDLELRDISTLPDPRGPYTVSAILRDGGVLRWRGDVGLHPIHSQGELDVRRVRIATAWRFLRDRFNLSEPAGMVAFSGRYRFAYADGTPQLALEDMRLAVTDIRLAAAGTREPMLALEAAEVTGGRFDLSARELVLPKVELRKGLVAAAADARGVLNWQRIVKETRAARPAAAPAPGGKPWKIRVEAARAGGVALRYRDRSRAAPLDAGVAGLDAALAADMDVGGGRTQVLVSGLSVQLGKVTLGEIGGAAPIASLEAVSLTGGSLDLEQRRIGVQRVAVSGGLVRIVRDKAGAVRIVNLLSTAGADGGRGEVAPIARAAVATGAAWRATLDAFELGGMRISLFDEGYEPAVAYDFDVVRAAVRNISTDGKAPVKFETALRVAQGGTVAAAGDIGDGYRRVAGKFRIERLALKPLQSVISRDGALKLETGDLSLDAKVEYRAGKEHSSLNVAGGARISNFLLNESAGGDRLIAWKELAASGVAFTLQPDRLSVEEVRLTEPGAKIVIFKDRSLNLVKAFQPPPEPGAAPAPAAPPPASARPAAAGPRLEVEVERVRVERGIVDFSDLSLVLPFAARVEEFNGTVTGVSSEAAGAATLKLEGKVGEFGLANVDGTLKPFQPKVHTDVGVVFRNVEMVPLSPYSATFAGRRIATGKVSLDLRYKIENSQLAGENSVVLERFTLGERVESPGALNLPFDLAIALLTDSDGKINVAVPVKGNVDDPQFSYSHLVWQAIATVITNIVTAPFRALAGLFGSGGESLENIAFDPGRATLRPPEREKLKRVASAIAKRPQLILVTEGQYGDADAAALRERDVALAIAGKLGRPPAPGAAPEPVNTLDGKTQRALEALFMERASDDALSKFVAETERTRGKPVDRANPVLVLAGRGSADGAFYQALLRRLNETARVPDDNLRQLADARSRVVAGHMRETLSVPESRLAARTATEPGAARVKLSFDVAGQPQK